MHSNFLGCKMVLGKLVMGRNLRYQMKSYFSEDLPSDLNAIQSDLVKCIGKHKVRRTFLCTHSQGLTSPFSPSWMKNWHG